MFANLIIYRIAPQWSATIDQVEQALAKAPFAECAATQEKSAGWIPPRGEAHGALAEAVGGQWMLRFMAETKVLPGSALARKVNEKAAKVAEAAKNAGKDKIDSLGLNGDAVRDRVLAPGGKARAGAQAPAVRRRSGRR